MGMTEMELYDMSPRTFQNKLSGFQKKLNREIENEKFTYKVSMENHRRSLYFGMLPNIAEKDREDIEDFWPLPWDKNYAEKVAKIESKESKKKKGLSPEDVQNTLKDLGTLKKQ